MTTQRTLNLLGEKKTKGAKRKIDQTEDTIEEKAREEKVPVTMKKGKHKSDELLLLTRKNYEQMIRPGRVYKKGIDTPHLDKLYAASVFILEKALQSDEPTWGVFAREDVPDDGKPLIEYTGKPQPHSETERLKSFYAVGLPFKNKQDEPMDMDALSTGSGAELINHSENPNCYFLYQNKKILVCPLRPIKKGEQLTADYGRVYMEKLSCRVANQNHSSSLSPAEEFKQRESKYNVKEALKGVRKGLPVEFEPKDMEEIPFVSAIKTGDTSFSIDEEQKDETRLMRSCLEGDFEEVKACIERGGFDVNRHTTDFETPLLFALRSAADKETKQAMVRYLMRKGAKPFTADKKNETALHYCIRNKFNEFLPLLLPGASKLDLDKFLFSPIQCALDCENYSAALTILEAATPQSFRDSIVEEVELEGKVELRLTGQLENRKGELLHQTLLDLSEVHYKEIYCAIVRKLEEGREHDVEPGRDKRRIFANNKRALFMCISSKLTPYFNTLQELILGYDLSKGKLFQELLEQAISSKDWRAVSLILDHATEQTLNAKLILKKTGLTSLGKKLKTALTLMLSEKDRSFYDNTVKVLKVKHIATKLFIDMKQLKQVNELGAQQQVKGKRISNPTEKGGYALAYMLSKGRAISSHDDEDRPQRRYQLR